MLLDWLKIKNFRNLKEAEIIPGKKLNLFLGQNAQGKTSLLESIYFLTHLNSFRTVNAFDCLSFEETTAQIEAGFLIESKNKQNIKIRFGQNDRQIFLNEKTVTKSKYLGQLKSIEFSPESLESIKQGPELRRKLLDEASALFFSEAQNAQETYQKVLQQRNAALKSIKTGTMAAKQARDIIESLMPRFIISATDVTYLRIQLIELLSAIYQNNLEEILGSSKKIQINYLINPEKTEKVLQYDQIKEEILAMVNAPQNREIEEVLGRTNAGPHKHQVEFVYDGKNSRFFSSQGQQRALILGFKISQIVYHKQTFGTHPLLLLDDVLSEFDETRQEYLVNFLQKNEAQTFLTATNYNQQLEGVKVFNLDAGRVKANGN